MLDVSSSTPPLLAKDDSNPVEANVRNRAESGRKSRESVTSRRQGSMPNRDSIDVNSGMSNWHPASLNKTGSKSPTVLPEPSVMRRSIGS